MRTVSFMLVSLSLVACGGPSLTGTWVGELDCGEGGDIEVEITLEESDKDNTFEGEGELKDITCSSSEGSFPCDFLFEIEIETEGVSGEQDLEIELDDCELKYDGNTQDTDCGDDFDDPEWDGENVITFESEGCDGELERDE